jgi:hypothetical protein
MKLTVAFVALVLSLPLAANAQLIRCTSADGKSSLPECRAKSSAG